MGTLLPQGVMMSLLGCSFLLLAVPALPTKPVTEWCADIDCSYSGQVCRIISHCSDDLPCPISGFCPWKRYVDGVLDDVCRRNGYQEALLNNLSPHYDKFQEWKCKGPGAFSECPSGSVCVDDGKDGGTCCLGQPTYDRPGSCPVNDLDACAGRSCDSDGECPGQEKCCDGDCGRRCIKPVHVTSCDNICPDGERCIVKPPDCEPSAECAQQEAVPTCVPVACAVCQSYQECRSLPRDERCFLSEAMCDGETIHFCAMKNVSECNTDTDCAHGQMCSDSVVCADKKGLPPPEEEAHPGVQESRNKREIRFFVPFGLYEAYCATHRVCVPDQCGGCPQGELCKQKEDDSYVCVTDDECGGCLDGLVCAATSRPKTDCPENDCEPVHKCVPPPGDAQTCGNAQCRAGFKCESYQPPCPPPSCPPFSESADCVMPNCPPLHMCTDLRPQSCRELQCSDGTRCKMIKDKCAPGKLCRKTKKAECVPVCSRECWGARKCKLVSKCPSDGGECEHQQRCVSARVPPGTCPQCKPGRECALRKRCRKCKPHHVCVLSQGVCPHLPARKLGPESATCKREMERSPYLCVVDTDCKKRQKCCTSVCERQICMAAQEP